MRRSICALLVLCFLCVSGAAQTPTPPSPFPVALSDPSELRAQDGTPVTAMFYTSAADPNKVVMQTIRVLDGKKVQILLWSVTPATMPGPAPVPGPLPPAPGPLPPAPAPTPGDDAETAAYNAGMKLAQAGRAADAVKLAMIYESMSPRIGPQVKTLAQWGAASVGAREQILDPARAALWVPWSDEISKWIDDRKKANKFNPDDASAIKVLNDAIARALRKVAAAG